MSVKKAILIILGCVCLALGTVGIALPVLPTTPFYLGTLYCFARSSERLHNWFLGTALYRKHLESYVEKRGMLLQTKLSILICVTILMAFGFFMMARKGIWIPCVILAVVWAAHFYYFLFRIKTIHPDPIEKGADSDAS